MPLIGVLFFSELCFQLFNFSFAESIQIFCANHNAAKFCDLLFTENSKKIVKVSVIESG